MAVSQGIRTGAARLVGQGAREAGQNFHRVLLQVFARGALNVRAGQVSETAGRLGSSSHAEVGGTIQGAAQARGAHSSGGNTRIRKKGGPLPSGGRTHHCTMGRR